MGFYLRAKRFRRKDGKERIYYYIVSGEVKNGKVKQKVVKYLGSAETILEKLNSINTVSNTIPFKEVPVKVWNKRGSV